MTKPLHNSQIDLLDRLINMSTRRKTTAALGRDGILIGLLAWNLLGSIDLKRSVSVLASLPETLESMKIELKSLRNDVDHIKEVLQRNHLGMVECCELAPVKYAE